MNKFTGRITNIQQAKEIQLVDIDVDGYSFSALLISSAFQTGWLQMNCLVDIIFKETEVSIVKNFTGKLSTRNRMKCKVLKIEKGEILSKIELQFHEFIIHSAITTRAVEYLELKVGHDVEALVKSNEISLSIKN